MSRLQVRGLNFHSEMNTEPDQSLLGPRNRAPLGLKTTNARTKAFQTPAPPLDNEAKKEEAKSASARKPKPKISHAEMTRLEVLGDKDELEEPEIEYMPPRANGSGFMM